MRAFSAAFALALCGCAPARIRPPQAGPAGLIAPAEGEGAVVFSGPSFRELTSFDAQRVIGPAVNLGRNADGSWSGWLMGRAVRLDPSPGRLDGASLSLAFEERDGGLEVRGHFRESRLGQTVYVRVSRDELFSRGALGGGSLFLEAVGAGRYAKGVGGRYAVELLGDALLPRPPEPQFVLALLGALGR